MREKEAPAAHAMRRSAEAVAKSTGELSDSADRRTMLAGDRTVLAAERTYAAWVRTALAALASGVGAKALFRDLMPQWVGLATATALILFAGFCLVAAIWRQLWDAVPPPHTDLRPMPHWVLVVFNGALLLVAAAALVGVWMVR